MTYILTRYRPQGVKEPYISISAELVPMLARQLSPTTYVVLLTVVAFQNKELMSFTSSRFLEKATGYSSKTVIKAIKELKEANLLTQTKESTYTVEVSAVKSPAEVSKISSTDQVKSTAEVLENVQQIEGNNSSDPSDPHSYRKGTGGKKAAGAAEVPHAQHFASEVEQGKACLQEDEDDDPEYKLLLLREEEEYKASRRLRFQNEQIEATEIGNRHMAKSFISKSGAIPPSYLVDQRIVEVAMCDLEKKIVFLTATNILYRLFQRWKYREMFSINSKADLERFGDLLLNFLGKHGYNWEKPFEKFCWWVYNNKGDKWAPALLNLYYQDWLYDVRIPGEAGG